MIVSAFCGAAVDEVEDHSLFVRAVIGMGADAIPPSLLQYIVMRYPSVLSTPGENGALPLHDAILVSSSHHTLVKTTHAYILNHLDDDCEEKDNSTSEKKCSTCTSEGGKQLTFEESKQYSEDDASSTGSHEDVEDILHATNPLPLHIILDAYPKAATVPDNSGRLPIHLAIEACISWDDGLGRLFDAAPETLRMPDPKTGLMPFMLAATASEEEDVSACNTIFQLLRLCPDLISTGLSSRNNKLSLKKPRQQQQQQQHEKRKHDALEESTQVQAHKKARQEGD